MIIVNGFQLNVTRFPNGEVTVDLNHAAIGKEYSILWKFESNEDFLLLNLLESYLIHNTNEKDGIAVNCNIAYMPYSRMDRSQNGSPFSLDKVAAMLPKFWDYTVWEPHSDQTMISLEKYCGGRVKEGYFTPHILSQLTWELNLKAVNNERAIVFPDKGAYLRYGKNELLGHKNPELDLSAELYGEKTRDFDTGDIESLIFRLGSGSLGIGFEAIIVDDLSSYGGTFVRSAKALRELGASKVYLVTGHAEESAFKGDLMNHIDKIYTTNSMNQGIATHPNVKIIDILQFIK